MNDIRTENPSTYFPKDRRVTIKPEKTERSDSALKPRNSKKRQVELKEGTENDARVDISNKIKDFSRIKKAADAAPEIDNRKKVEQLKKQVADGTYKVNVDDVADKILEQELM
ncbi:MAG: flagellar biosynthesis anti-sigma factor FlgM [Oligoflexia bacterium]|nr:flagellar biosynthesis anti-sigma factor FlgM [Oligoflexia bacterium]MBF0366113.1 flagellar biosynthesis anti-sigma factor FlgM [Oligoflexia bacterium]